MFSKTSVSHSVRGGGRYLFPGPFRRDGEGVGGRYPRGRDVSRGGRYRRGVRYPRGYVSGGG